MEIFGIGAMEMVVLLVLAMIIVGPQKLPEISRNLGKTVAEFKAQADALKKTVDFESLTAPLSTTTTNSNASVPGTQISNLPDARLIALQTFYGDQRASTLTPTSTTPVAQESITIAPVAEQAEVAKQA